VMKGPAIPTWPVSSPSRWNVLVEALLVGNTVVTPNTTVVGAPANRAVALLDSGTSYSSVHLPTDVVFTDPRLVMPQRKSARRFMVAFPVPSIMHLWVNGLCLAVQRLTLPSNSGTHKHILSRDVDTSF
jgi:hypothetical protein